MAIDMKAMAKYVFEIDRLGSVFRKAMHYSSEIYANARSEAFIKWLDEGRKPKAKRRFLTSMTKALIKMDRAQIEISKNFSLDKVVAKVDYENETLFNRVMVSHEFYGTRTE